jgi:hypothetical protein
LLEVAAGVPQITSKRRVLVVVQAATGPAISWCQLQEHTLFLLVLLEVQDLVDLEEIQIQEDVEDHPRFLALSQLVAAVACQLEEEAIPELQMEDLVEVGPEEVEPLGWEMFQQQALPRETMVLREREAPLMVELAQLVVGVVGPEVQAYQIAQPETVFMLTLTFYQQHLYNL